MSTSASPAQRIDFGWQAASVSAALVVLTSIGLTSLRSPPTLALVATLAVLGTGILLVRAPIALFWLVPVSLAVHIYSPLFHYEALVLFLAAAMLLARLQRGETPRLVLQPIEWWTLLFLLSTLPGLLVAGSVWRFGGAFKVWVVGLVAFVVARHATRWFGREALLWGVAGFCTITFGMLSLRVVQLGVPSFRNVQMRNFIADLGWGTSNYIAAVVVVCFPAMMFLLRSSRSRWSRMAALAAIVGTAATILMTSSRGGALLATGYFLSLFGGVRRRLPALLAVLAIVIAVLVFTPLGSDLVSRFTTPDGMDSLLTRWMIWQESWTRGLNHLPFGLGAGQGWIYDDRLKGIDAHNYLLTLFSDTGPLSTLLWVAVMAAVFGAARRLSARPDTRAAGDALLGTLVIAFLNSLFEPTMVGTLYHLLFWWLVGILHGVGEPADLPAAPRGT